MTGASDHGVSKSLYGRDPDGNEFEVMWQVPREAWGQFADEATIMPLDLEAEAAPLGSRTPCRDLAWPVQRSDAKRVELVGVLLEVVDDEPLHDPWTVISPRVGCVPRRSQASVGPARARSVTRPGPADALEQRSGSIRRSRSMAPTRPGIGLHAPERDRLDPRRRDDALGLLPASRPGTRRGGPRPGRPPSARRRRDRVRSGRSALWPAAWATRRRSASARRAKEGVDVGGHRTGARTTGAVSSPSRSIASVTVSPGSR